jgi:hypothetical protein
MEISERQVSRSGWLESAIFALDGWLRRCQDIYEYTVHSRCLFRIQRARAGYDVTLRDGTRVRRGDPVLILHFWNEHVPSMGSRGPTLAWARQARRALDTSLRELARYLAYEAELEDVSVICGDMRVRSVAQARQIGRIMARYGFECVDCGVTGAGWLHRIGDNILILMLVLATNPFALRSALFRYVSARITLSRAALERRYGTHANLTTMAHA